MKSYRFPDGISIEGAPIFLGLAKVPPASRELTSDPATKTALAAAEHLFFSGLEAAPVQEADHPLYRDWWAASKLRSDEYLRLVLGVDRCNRLTAQAAAVLAESLRAPGPDTADSP